MNLNLICSVCQCMSSSKIFQVLTLLHFPNSWEAHGFARIMLYYKKNFECCRITELEDDHVQAIWVKSGFKNGKKGYYCHMYREHTSHLGSSLQVQKDYLSKFINQCENALLHNNPHEPNEVFILGDMNVDSYLNKWMSRDYSLYS